MPRYKISVEYDGGPFVGWQRQDTGPSIQAALEDAIAAFTGERAHVQGAGRTDAGWIWLYDRAASVRNRKRLHP